MIITNKYGYITILFRPTLGFNKLSITIDNNENNCSKKILLVDTGVQKNGVLIWFDTFKLHSVQQPSNICSKTRQKTT